MWLSTRQYADMMGLHLHTVERMCREDRVPNAIKVIRVGNRWRIRIEP